MINTALLAEICKVAGAPGHEQRVREVVLREVKSLVDEIRIEHKHYDDIFMNKYFKMNGYETQFDPNDWSTIIAKKIRYEKGRSHCKTIEIKSYSKGLDRCQYSLHDCCSRSGSRFTTRLFRDLSGYRKVINPVAKNHDHLCGQR